MSRVSKKIKKKRIILYNELDQNIREDYHISMHWAPEREMGETKVLFQATSAKWVGEKWMKIIKQILLTVEGLKEAAQKLNVKEVIVSDDIIAESVTEAVNCTHIYHTHNQCNESVS